MNEMIQTVIAAILAFAATNVDDIIVLMLLFGQRDHFQTRQVIMGQYLGFLVLVLASLPGFFGGLFLPRPWIGLLGLLPIAIGVHQLWQNHTEEASVQTISVPSASGELASGTNQQAPRTSCLQQPIFQVAAITVANGGDNIGIYVPLFASSSVTDLVIILITFLVMIAVWCAIALSLARHPAIAKLLTRYGHRLVPFVLIGLGIYILLESKSYTLVSFASPW
jgi:cadmium resistance transport/sequestration family protein